MLKFKINIAKTKKHINRPSSVNTNKSLTKLVRGLIKEDANGICMCRLKCTASNGEKIDGVYYFTEDSYELKGKLIVFTKEARCNVYIRNEDSAKRGNNPDRYTTLRKNWICEGHLVQQNGKRLFRLGKVIKPYTKFEDINND